MKNLIIAALIAITLFSCTKENKSMSAEELKAKYNIVLPELQYEGEEIAVSPNRGGKKKASEQVVVVWENDLILSGGVTCTVSPNAEWGGIQRFNSIPLNVDGATSPCNYYWPSNPTTMNCPVTASGVYRGFTSDHDYNIHISNLVTIP